ncbi:MAG: hypothetical protein V7706_07750 [Dietzia psychralcaliphila]
MLDVPLAAQGRVTSLLLIEPRQVLRQLSTGPVYRLPGIHAGLQLATD